MANWANNAEKEVGANTDIKAVSFSIVFMIPAVTYVTPPHKTQNNFVEPAGSTKVFK